MAKIIEGERIGKNSPLSIGCSAAIFSADRSKVLLVRRTDNGLWCLPGGHAESGESLEETCIREVREETGLKVQVVRLIGIYSSPHRIVEYPDGNRYHPITLNFEAEVIDGHLHTSSETSEFGYFTPEEIPHIGFMQHLYERIEDAFANQERTFMR